MTLPSEQSPSVYILHYSVKHLKLQHYIVPVLVLSKYRKKVKLEATDALEFGSIFIDRDLGCKVLKREAAMRVIKTSLILCIAFLHPAAVFRHIRANELVADARRCAVSSKWSC